jgi:hypothetical protein
VGLYGEEHSVGCGLGIVPRLWDGFALAPAMFHGPPKFFHTFFSFLFSLTGLILAIVWLRGAAFPEDFGPSDAAYASFAQSLTTKFSKSYWPYVIAALPWIALRFKTLGLTFAEGATETFAKSRRGGGQVASAGTRVAAAQRSTRGHLKPQRTTEPGAGSCP